MTLTDRERDTLLAALRLWGGRNLPRLTDGLQAEKMAGLHGPALDAEEINELASNLRRATDLTDLPDVPELAGTLPVVLYLRDEADREELIAALKQAKPGMITRRL